MKRVKCAGSGLDLGRIAGTSPRCPVCKRTGILLTGRRGQNILTKHNHPPRPLTAHQKIALAARLQKGATLSRDAVEALGRDHALALRAQLDDAADERGCYDGWHEDPRATPLFNTSSPNGKAERCPACRGPE